MTQPSPDARAVVRALDALTTQVRRLADGAATPVVAPSGYHPTGVRPEPTTAPDTPSPLAADRADDDQKLRWARRESLLVLLTRLQRGRHLTEDEARTLRHHVETEMREADTAREVARGNLRHVRILVPELEQAQAAIERVREVTARRLADDECGEWERHGYHSALNDVRRALNGTEQPTTKD